MGLVPRVASIFLALALISPGWASVAPRDTDPGVIVHTLNRLTYGPHRGDLERVRQLGLQRWIDLQLHPERIDDTALATRLASFRTLALSSHELLARYEIPREAKIEAQRQRAALGDRPSEAQVEQLRRELIQKYRGQMDGSPRQVLSELQEAKILRAVYGERQLNERVVDFWMNHFNVYAQKGPEKFLVGAYERDAIRPHAWGHFEDLLRATAESPAMLFYLDNWLSSAPNAPTRRAPDPAVPAQNRRPRGLNENYAREIMELHTLGVDGGYTQNDVTEVARCFTGWTIRGARGDDPVFAFNPRLHDGGDKRVLGHRISGGGRQEGDQVLHLLATHPSTARFIAMKLARHFVADDPPRALVDRAAEAFRHTDGDIREVLRTILTSPEFLADTSRGTKIKTPLEFVVSALRASDAEVRDAAELSRRVAAMGMPLYLQQPPTGYKDTAETWVSTSGLLARLNFALDLAGGRVRGVTMDRESALLLGSPEFQRR